MPTYQPYSPDQAELLPAHVKDVLGADPLCFLVHEVVESFDLGGFEGEEEDAGGQRPYDPRLITVLRFLAEAALPQNEDTNIRDKLVTLKSGLQSLDEIF